MFNAKVMKHRKFVAWHAVDTRKVLTAIRVQIRVRIKAAVDASAAPFEPYTKTYAKAKHKRKVNLRDTGTMLRSFRNKVWNTLNKRGGALIIGTPYAATVDSKRPFMGMNEDTVDANEMEVLAERYDRNVRKSNKR